MKSLLEGGTAARAAGSAIKMGVQAGTEGALTGVGQTVSEVALSDEPMNAEAIAARLGSNMLFSGGTAASVIEMLAHDRVGSRAAERRLASQCGNPGFGAEIPRPSHWDRTLRDRPVWRWHSM